MKAFEQLERLTRMNELLKQTRTGSPNEFAQTLGISRRQLYADLEYLHDLGVETGYSKCLRSFYLANGHELEVKYSIKIIPRQIAQKIDGGAAIFNYLYYFGNLNFLNQKKFEKMY